MMIALEILIILIFVPLAGGLLSGLDRKITARMQRRKGPPLLQPFYDVHKLLQKQSTTVNTVTRFYITLSLGFMVFTTVLLFTGHDILLTVFAFTLTTVFFIIAGYSSDSPYSLVGTERELLQVMAYEPMVLITIFGFYKVTHTFEVSQFLTLDKPIILKLPLIFIGLLYALTFKLRKSPFDLSTSHHGHQELVKGITTELTGICMAMVEITHWLETMFALALVYMFFVCKNPYSHLVALTACAAVFFFEIFIDNTFARFKWQLALKTSWLITAVTGIINLLLLTFF